MSNTFFYTPWEHKDLVNNQIPKKTTKPYRIISGQIGMTTGVEVAMCTSEKEAIAMAKKLAKDKVDNASPLEDWGFFVFHLEEGYIWEIVREWDPIIGITPNIRKSVTGNFDFAARTGKANRKMNRYPAGKQNTQFINKKLKLHGVPNAVINDAEASLIALRCIGMKKPWKPYVQEYLNNMNSDEDLVKTILNGNNQGSDSEINVGIIEESTDNNTTLMEDSVIEPFQPIPIKVENGFACPITGKIYKALGKRLIEHMVDNMPDNALPVSQWEAYEIDGVWYCPYTGKSYKTKGKRLETQLALARAEFNPQI